MIASRWQDIWSFIYAERLHRPKFLEGEPSGTRSRELKMSPFRAGTNPRRCSLPGLCQSGSNVLVFFIPEKRGARCYARRKKTLLPGRENYPDRLEKSLRRQCLSLLVADRRCSGLRNCRISFNISSQYDSNRKLRFVTVLKSVQDRHPIDTIRKRKRFRKGTRDKRWDCLSCR